MPTTGEHGAESIHHRASLAGTRVCFIAAVPLTIKSFLAGHIETLLKEGAEVHLVSNWPDVISEPPPPGARVHHVAISRRPAPFSDLRTVIAMWRLLGRIRPHLVQTITPKAGLLGSLAAWARRVPVRIHYFTGQVWATRTGLSRALLKRSDSLIAALTTRALTDSSSQRDFLLEEGVLPSVDVLLQGSVGGVNLRRFRPDGARRETIRASLAVPAEAMVVLFIGRLTREKGVIELARAFGEISSRMPDVYLVLVGPDEAGLRDTLVGLAGAASSRLRLVGHVANPEHFMQAADVMVLPSWREGFGTVIIEAAACGIPAVGSDIYGLRDSIVDGSTGILHPTGDAEALRDALAGVLADGPYRQRLAGNALHRAVTQFRAEDMSAALLGYYCEALAASSSSPAHVP